MAQKFGNGIDLQKGAVINVAIQPSASAPASPVLGQVYFDTGLLQLLSWNGSAWVNFATNSALLGGQAGSFYTARANATGTQLSATISDLSTTVQGYRLNQFAAPNASIPMAGFTLTGLGTPNAAGQAAEYAWVQNAIASATSSIKAVKDPVRTIFTTNVTTSGIPVANDGVTLVAGDRVLLTGQTTASTNAIFVVSAGTWTLAPDFNSSTVIEPGTEVLVNEGMVYGGSIWRISNTGAIVLSTTSLTWTQTNKINVYQAGSGLTLTGLVFSVTPVASGGIVVSGSGIAVDTTIVARKFSVTIGDGSTTNITVTHNLNTLDVNVSVYLISTGEQVLTDNVRTGVNAVSVQFGTAPATGAYRVVVTG